MLLAYPTAVQALALTQETPLKTLNLWPVDGVEGIVLQTLPFQDSAKAKLPVG